jgi:thiamine monophosphate synthase
MLGISVHSAEAAKAAEEFNPDYMLAGTVFDSLSHKGENGGGLDHLHGICTATVVPVIAIGGITPANAGDCIKAGAAGVAALSPFRGAGRQELAKAYKEAMR